MRTVARAVAIARSMRWGDAMGRWAECARSRARVALMTHGTDDDDDDDVFVRPFGADC
jgi:hypothetical protein